MQAVREVGLGEVTAIKFFENRANGQSKGWVLTFFFSLPSMSGYWLPLISFPPHCSLPSVVPFFPFHSSSLLSPCPLLTVTHASQSYCSILPCTHTHMHTPQLCSSRADGWKFSDASSREAPGTVSACNTCESMSVTIKCYFWLCVTS